MDYAWDFLEREGQWTTVSGSDKYAYTTIATGMSITTGTIREIRAMVNDTYGGYLMESMDWSALENISDSTQETGEGTGTPLAWSKWGDAATATVRLYPKPDAVYTIGTYAILRPAVLTANADVPLFPADFAHRILVPYAAAILLEQEGGAEAGADYERRMTRYREGLRDLITAHGTGKRPTFNVVAAGAFDHLPGSGSAGW